MRRRTVGIALLVVAGVAAFLVLKRRSSHFDTWPRFSELPGGVPLAKSTRVKVIDEHGPVGGAELHVARYESFEAVTVGADGTIELPTPDSVILFASKGSRVSRRTFVFDEVPPEGVVLPLLDQSAAADVLVIDSEGRPIAGARLSLALRWRILEATTGADGVAHFEPVPDGIAEVVASSDGRTAFTFLALLEGERTRGVIQMQPSCVLRGEVVDATTRAPIADAGVALLGLVDGATILSENTGARGEFEFPVRTSATFFARASAAGFVDNGTPAAPGCSPLRIELSRGVPQFLRTVDADGRGLPGVDVRLRPRWWMSDWLFTGRSDATGNYETPPLTADEPWVAEATFANGTRVLEWAPASDGGVSRLELSTDWVSRRVSGRVVDAKTGAPIPGAEIGDGAMTERDGTFNVVLLGTGTLRRRVWADGYFFGELTSKVEGEVHVVRLDRTDWVTGRVVDEKGRPMPRFSVDRSTFQNTNGTFLSSMHGKTVTIAAWGFEVVEREFDASDLGTIQLRRVKPLLVTVLGPDGGPIAAEVMSAEAAPEHPIAALRKGELGPRGSSDETGVARVILPPGECVLASRFPYVPSSCMHPDGGAVTVQLTEAGAIEGVLRGHSEAQGDARVELTDGEGATFAERGHFKLWPLSAGHHTLRVRMPSGSIWQREVDVDAGATTEVLLNEAEGAQLNVEVTTTSGAVIWVTISQGDERVERGGSPDVKTHMLKLSFTGLREGRAEVTIQQGDLEQQRQVFLSATPHDVSVPLP